MDSLELAAISAAAFAAGGVNAIAGGGTVISFPTLLWIGLDPVVANATNQVALWPGVAAGAFGFRREMMAGDRKVIWLAVPAAFGGTAGAVLLLSTPSEFFANLAPFLILFATGLLAVRGPTARLVGKRLREESSPSWWAAAVPSHLAIAVYGGYFGAGLGILLLTMLSLLGLTDIHRMNGLKNLLSVFIQGASVVYLGVQGAVMWTAGITMAVASILGGLMAAGVARRVDREIVRKAVLVIGVGMAISLLVRLTR